MKRHLQLLVTVFIVHIVNDVERVDIELAEPRAGLGEPGKHPVIIQEIPCQRLSYRSDLFAGLLVPAAVDRIQECLREIHAGAEELHLLADTHRGYAARDRIVVAKLFAHQIVVLILNRRSVDRYVGAVVLEILRKLRAPEYGKIRLGRGP